MPNEIENIPEHNIGQGKPSDSPDQVKDIFNLKAKDLLGSFGFIKKAIPFVGIIGLSIGCLFVIYLLIIPQYQSYKQLGLDLVASEATLKDVTDRLSYLQGLYDLRDQLVSNTQLAIESMPDNKDKIPSVLDQLLQISEEFGVEVVSQSLVGILVPEDTLEPKSVKIQMQLTGDRQKLLGFLNAVSTNRTIIDVDNFNLDKVAKKADTADTTGPPDTSDTYDLKLSLVSYYLEDIANQNMSAIEGQKPLTDLDMVLNEIRNMKYYEPRQSEVVIGKEDPFADVPVINESETVQEEDTGIISQ